MSAALPIPVIQLLQVLTVALGAPGVTGVIAKVEARLQGRRGPRICQPYYDLAKLFRKEALAPEGASWFFLAAPLIAVTCYLTIPLLIPVLTSYPLPLGYMGDILGGGFLLSLASFVVATAALETGSPYAQLGSSRAKTFSAITEPVVLFVVFTVALLTGTDLPYALAATVRSSAGQIIRPAHLLAAAALFMVILHETGRIPVETPHRHERVRDDRGGPGVRAFRPVLRAAEVGQRAQAADPVHDPGQRVPGAVGPGLHPAPGAVVLAIAALLAKACAVGVVVAVIDNSFAKLRLFKITEFVVGRVPARRARRVHAVPRGWLMDAWPWRGPGGAGVYQGVANVIAAVMLLIEFGMLRQALGRDQVRLYMAQSALLSVLAVVVAADRNLPDLYALAALSAALKVVAVPLVLRRVLGWTGGEGRDEEEPVGVAGSHTLSPASAVLAGIVLAAFGFFCFGAMQIHGPAAPATALSIAGAMVLVAFGLMIVRRDVASQAIGFLSLENAHLAGGAGGSGRAAADPGGRASCSTCWWRSWCSGC